MTVTGVLIALLQRPLVARSLWPAHDRLGRFTDAAVGRMPSGSVVIAIRTHGEATLVLTSSGAVGWLDDVAGRASPC